MYLNWATILDSAAGSARLTFLFFMASFFKVTFKATKLQADTQSIPEVTDISFELLDARLNALPQKRFF
jgi:hypothetical protein